MQTRITARRSDIPDGLRAHIEQSVSKLDRYYDGIYDAHVVLTDGDGGRGKAAEVTVNVRRQTLKAQNAAPTHEEAITGCVRELRRQVLRYKDRLRSTDKDVHR
ncbi:MAG: ribosome-associated translation inhibitor RaiA [Rhodothermales bacterium]|nr:ribosome-associated translation inhibitor RaiA [Rhodothermales bacterium]